MHLWVDIAFVERYIGILLSCIYKIVHLKRVHSKIKSALKKRSNTVLFW